jgi:hypothetical protein
MNGHCLDRKNQDDIGASRFAALASIVPLPLYQYRRRHGYAPPIADAATEKFEGENSQRRGADGIAQGAVWESQIISALHYSLLHCHIALPSSGHAAAQRSLLPGQQDCLFSASVTNAAVLIPFAACFATDRTTPKHRTNLNRRHQRALVCLSHDTVDRPR